MKIRSFLTLSTALLSSIFCPVPQTSVTKRQSPGIVVDETDPIIIDDGCQVSALKQGIVRHQELEAATLRAVMSVNPFDTPIEPPRKFITKPREHSSVPRKNWI